MGADGSNPVVHSLRAAAKRSKPGGVKVLEEAAQALAHLLATGRATDAAAVPALTRLQAAAIAHADARLLRGAFTFRHDGCRYRGHRFKSGNTEVRTWRGHVLTLGLPDTPQKDLSHD